MPEFSVQSFPYTSQQGQHFTYYAVAIDGVIAWDVWPDGSRTPFVWANTHEELQAMIDRQDPCILASLAKAARDARPEACAHQCYCG